MLSRRDLVGKLAAGTAAVCAVGVARASLATTRPQAIIGGANPGQADSGRVSAAQPELADASAAAAEQECSQSIVDSAPPSTLSAEQPWELLHPLAMGSAVAHGWRVAGLTGAVDGTCVLTLQNERGRSHRVHLCRNDGSPQGLVFTKQLDLVVMNGGEGDLPTEEGLAQAVAEVAHVLAANEGHRKQDAVMTSLLAHSERVQRFSGAEDRRLR